MIRKAYAKMDPASVSNVCLDDIAKCYDVRGNRDTAGARTQEQHYTTFMGLWNLGFADAQVSYDMF